ncbi:MAG: hypothetical protein LBG28_05535 [Tannerella sp.]|nr:hypothetical protein [Tannerella sp.]
MSEETEKTLYTYTLKGTDTQTSYDEAMAVTCIQGIMNRGKTRLYVRSNSFTRPNYWMEKFASEGWLSDKVQTAVSSLDALVEIAGEKLKGIIIWDTSVPATINLATTLAGLEDGIVLSPEMAKTYQNKWNLPVIKDFRGQFTGSETGSKKNDAYRWAVREFIETGRCNPHWLCLYEDSYMTRYKGDVSYVVTRDWAVYNRAFVYDLSPWGDETPFDDSDQPPGTDLQTYKFMLEANMKQTNGRQMTEVAGFFSFAKYSNIPDYPSKHDPVPTEWETVYLISPYNCYQNTVAHNCYNQSVHSQAPVGNMKQGRPILREPQDGKTYICILMADYDSTTPLYDFMPTHWDDTERGAMPFLWGINPNLSETYPDIMQYLYRTKSDNDYFAADASAAGYMNPNRIDPIYLPLFVEHNKKFYEQWDMSLSPMVLDWDEPTDAVKDAFLQFSPDGYATIVMDLHNTGGKLPQPHVWKSMPVMELINNACNFSIAGETARIMSSDIPAPVGNQPRYYFFRIVWTSPNKVIDAVNRLQSLRPELDIEVIDPYNFFHFFKLTYNNQQ